MDVVSTNDIICARAAHVDAISVAHLLHYVMNFVILDQVVMRVQIGSHLLQGFDGRPSSNFVPTDGSR